MKCLGLVIGMTNNLSENQYLSKDELSTGEMKESEIILHLLFPPHEETARTIEPGMGAFHDPTASTIARDELLLALLFAPSTTKATCWPDCGNRSSVARQ